MEANLRCYARLITFTCMALFACFMPTVFASEVEEFVAKLKAHYQDTLSIQTYSLNYHFLNKLYRSHDYWDYRTPNRNMSVRMVEVDLVKKHFYDNDILYFSGGLLWDRAQFQNDKESYYYERSGMFMGKGMLKQGMDNFDRFNSYNILNIDFLAVRPLLEESNIKKNITLDHNIKLGTSTLIHKASDDNIIAYEFNSTPLQLVSLNKKSKQARYVYSDYQTTRGITFARVVHKFHSGATEPNYISYNDKFEVIDAVDANKLKIPSGYTELPKSDGVLVATEIASNLYLVTDSAGRSNGLFKINDDEIIIFGATSSSGLAKKTLTLIHKQYPNKNITSVYVSHAHRSEIDGLNAYAEQSIEILADENSIAAIKAYPKFTDDITKFKFRTITHEQSFDDSHFYVLESMHAKRHGFVYFKDSGTIFQSDFLHIPVDNTIAKVIPNYTRTFIDFIRNKRLKVNRIVSHYGNNNVSEETMNKTYNAMM